MLDEIVLCLAADQGGAVTVPQLRAAGVTAGVIRQRVASGAWRRPFVGVIVPDPTVSELRARCASSALVVAPELGVISHLTAARIHRLEGIPRWTPDEPVHVTLPREAGRRHRPGLARHWTAVPEEQRVTVDGIAVTNLDRTLVDLALTSDRVTAICAAESALRQGRTLGDLARIGAGRHGARRIEPWWALADVRFANPLETRVRLHLIDAGLPPDELQYEVRLGDLVMYLDMAYLAQRVAVETDGQYPHLARRQFIWDRRKWTALREDGWTLVHLSWADSWHRAYVVQTVDRALQDADRRHAG